MTIIDGMETEILWRAVGDRDARFDGTFVFAVATTGIFCRPSCKARRPKRENVRFFAATVEAEACGYRPCLRCRPTAVDADPVVTAIVTAIREIEEFPEASLDELASTAGLSSYHFQRKFKEIVGISPKRYSEAIKMERFKDEVRSGRDVTTAIYEAGFGSARAIYEKANEALGMTPAAYKKGGKGVSIEFTTVECDLGIMLVARTKRGICSVSFSDDRPDLISSLGAEFPNADIVEDSSGLEAIVRGILDHLAGRSRRLVLPLDLQATAFQLQVWEMLRKIPYGETRSYAEIAEQIGDRRKVRAVARACATNRVALVIPCHRVVASDGRLSGYRWGIERKKKLLERESSGAKTSGR